LAVTGPGDVTPPVTAKNPLVPGEHSDRVRVFQVMLNHRGFVVPLTGVFDKPTTSAYTVAQHSLGLDPPFVTCGPATWTAISRMKIERHTRPVKGATWRPKASSAATYSSISASQVNARRTSSAWPAATRPGSSTSTLATAFLSARSASRPKAKGSPLPVALLLCPPPVANRPSPFAWQPSAPPL